MKLWGWKAVGGKAPEQCKTDHDKSATPPFSPKEQTCHTHHDQSAGWQQQLREGLAQK